MKIWATMVVRNEAHRYLFKCIRDLSKQIDGVAILDDGSTDDSVSIARDLGAYVLDTPGVGFMEDESLARQLAWDWMEEALRPRDGDWILCIDADEFLTDAYQLYKLVQSSDALGIVLPIREVFDIASDNCPLVRMDGFWGAIQGLRVVRWEPSGLIPEKKEAPGSAPSYAYTNVQGVERPSLLHYGYAREEDRMEKFLRYNGREGHNPAHINSILAVPTLVRWN